ncbi:Wzz/FepE/Etk N-terminal domain-containing protein [Candidatus Pelagibacter sp. Uisw_090]|uniref:Wzz/FepE/Etk N-terminal domain-containing protein n=1 Tax=Candidatus Pelagibacter sp. Uisw_090 TaxID=3230993 RepID=UPI0039EC62D5
MNDFIKKSEDSEIDLLDLLRTLLRHKTLIVGLTVLFGIFGFIANQMIPAKVIAKQFQTNLILKEPSSLDLKIITDHGINFVNVKNLKKEFFFTFRQDLISETSFKSFVKKYPNKNSFLKPSNKQEGNVDKFLEQTSLESTHIKNNIFTITLIYPEEIKGSNLLDDYVESVSLRSKDTLINQIKNLLLSELANVVNEKRILVNSKKRSIINQLFAHQQALKTAESIASIEGVGFRVIENYEYGADNNNLYLKGIKVLNAEILNLKEQLNYPERMDDYNLLLSKEELIQSKIKSLKQTNFNWAMPLSYQKEITISSNKKSHLLPIGLIIGFALSLLIIFFRYISNILKG